jgi:hypothetical protein
VKLISLVNSERCKWHHLVISLELTNYYEIGLKVTSDMVGLMGGNLCEDSPSLSLLRTWRSWMDQLPLTS